MIDINIPQRCEDEAIYQAFIYLFSGCSGKVYYLFIVRFIVFGLLLTRMSLLFRFRHFSLLLFSGS